jgi:hypothetical protein
LKEVDKLLNVVLVVVCELVGKWGVVKVVGVVVGVLLVVSKTPDKALDRFLKLKAAE